MNDGAGPLLGVLIDCTSAMVAFLMFASLTHSIFLFHMGGLFCSLPSLFSPSSSSFSMRATRVYSVPQSSGDRFSNYEIAFRVIFPPLFILSRLYLFSPSTNYFHISVIFIRNCSYLRFFRLSFCLLASVLRFKF